MTTIIPCTEIAEELLDRLRNNPRKTLSIVIVGENPASLKYADRIRTKCRELPVDVNTYRLDGNISKDAFEHCLKYIIDGTDGIIIMQPIREDLKPCYDLIPPEKDIDCATDRAFGRIATHSAELVPPTVGAILEIIDRMKIPTEGRTVLIVNRSNIIGRPLALALSSKKYNATPIIAHSHSSLNMLTQISDIVITAVGKPRIFDHRMFYPGQVVIDAGTTMVDGKVVGDIDTEKVTEVLEDGMITTVPKGVGAITVAKLVSNLWATDYMPETQ